MSTDIFRVTFHGEVIQGWDPDEARVHMQRLFKLDKNNPQHKQKLDKLFSGRKVVIKADLSAQAAQAYVNAIAKAGGEARIYPDPEDLPPDNVDERRHTKRRKQGDRRRLRRLSSILPDRRSPRGRRRHDAAA